MSITAPSKAKPRSIFHLFVGTRIRNLEVDFCFKFFRMVIRFRVLEIMLQHHLEARKLTPLSHVSLQRGGSDSAVNDDSGGSSDGVNQWSLDASDVEDGV